jgi:hypothetical protein
VGAVLLVVAVVAAAVPVAGHVGLARAVAGKIRHGICIVTGGVCTPADAEAAGLLPCTVRERTGGEENGTTFLLFRGRNRDNWVLAERSDGSVVVTHADETDVGAGGEVDVLGLSLSGSLMGGIHERRTWEFPDLETAKAFLAARRDPEEAARRYPPKYVYKALAGGGQGSVPGESIDEDVAVGRRTGGGMETVFLRARVPDPGPFAALAGLGATQRWEEIVVEHTRDRSGPRELAFHLQAPGSRAKTTLRVTGRLDLRDPANAEAARALLRLRAPWPPAVVADLRAAVARTMEAGIVEAELLSVEASESGFDVSLPVVKAVGVHQIKRRSTVRLLAARAWVNGVARDREDCLG